MGTHNKECVNSKANCINKRKEREYLPVDYGVFSNEVSNGKHWTSRTIHDTYDIPESNHTKILGAKTKKQIRGEGSLCAIQEGSNASQSMVQYLSKPIMISET